MRCYRRSLNTLCKDHVTNIEVFRKIQAAIEEYDELLSPGEEKESEFYSKVGRKTLRN